MHSGSCHCGAVTYTVDAPLDKAIECNCSICSRKGYLLSFVPREQLQVQTGEDAMTTYKFNTHRISHQFCATCGCAPFGLGSAPDGTETAAINLRCIQDLDLASVKITPYDGKDK